ncbi:MAG: Bug family tripartite tricarboxylate transporter substrate binding protein [Hyphomicrobiaceae bacterium]
MFHRFRAALAAFFTLFAGAAVAQEAWPTRAVTVVVPFAAGGNADTLARIYAERMSARLGQQFVIENRAGAGGVTGVAAMAKSTPDGYTLGVGTASGLATNPVILKEKMPYDAGKDIAYLHLMATQPNLLVVHPSVPAKNLTEFVAWLKANPDQAYATSGIGSSQHLCGEMLIQQTGIKMSPVAYRASNQTMQDLVAGQVKIACDNFSTAWEQAKVNNVRAIAVTSAKRYPFAPDVATFAETLPGFEVTAWFGWIAPAGVPKAILDKAIAALNAVGEEPDVKKRLAALAVEHSGIHGAAFADLARKDRDMFAPIVEKAGIKAP